MTLIATLLSPTGFLWHLVGLIALTVLLALGVGPQTAEWALLAVIISNGIGIASASPSVPTKETTP